MVISFAFFLILLVGPRVWDCYFSVGSSCRDVARVYCIVVVAPLSLCVYGCACGFCVCGCVLWLRVCVCVFAVVCV